MDRREHTGRIIAASIAAVVLTVSAAGCSMEEGPAGNVVNADIDIKTKKKKDKDGKTKYETKTTYKLSTSNTEGQGEVEFKVPYSDFMRCPVGSYYPDCKNGEK